MPANFVEHPQLNKLYLLKRNKAGSAVKRFQPGTILEIKTDDGHMITQRARVHWQYDGVIEDDIMLYYGFAQELTRRWLDMEAKRLDDELAVLKRAVQQVDSLRFNPTEQAKITS